MVSIDTSNNERVSHGQQLYLTNCAACHGRNMKGASTEYPSLINIAGRLNDQQIHTVIKNGSGRMPSFQHIPERDRKTLVDFLTKKETNRPAKNKTNESDRNSDHRDSENNHPAVDSKLKADRQNVAVNENIFPYNPPYVLKNGLNRFLDPDGYPAIKPPWGTLNAVNLNTGEYLWKVPLGEFTELTKKGIPVTGTENYGGPIVTAGGLVFIAGTKDERIRAYDKQTGQIAWEFQLPAGGFATPITYKSGGKQYIVIAAGGVKNDHKPGGKYIAFALP